MNPLYPDGMTFESVKDRPGLVAFTITFKNPTTFCSCRMCDGGPMVCELGDLGGEA